MGESVKKNGGEGRTWKKMFEPRRISRRARGSKACRTAAAKRARRVLFPRSSQPFFSFRTSAGSFLLAFPFLLREKKREIQDARSVRPYWPGRYCRRFSFGINSGYILNAASRTVSPRIKCGMTKGGIPWIPHQVRDDWVTTSGAIEQTKKVIIKKCGMCLPKVRLTKAGISGYRIKVRDDWETASGAIEQTKKVIIKKCGISLPKVRDDPLPIFSGSPRRSAG